MSEFIEAPVVAQHRFTNFEVFSCVLSGYDLDIKQIDRGAFSAFLQQIQCGPVFISRFTTTRRIEANGSPPPGVRTFGIPTTQCQSFVWRNLQSSNNTMVIYKPSTEVALITSPKFEAIDVSISEDDFNALNHQWGFPDLDEMIGAREMVACDPAVMYRLRETLQYICLVIDGNPDELEQNIALQNLMKYEVPYLFAQALVSSKTHHPKTTPNKKKYALTTAIDYIQSATTNTTSVSRFCQETGINERTLQRAFLEQYGVTPKSYMQAFRLNNVYKMLLHSNPDTTSITDIASNMGYWHMSQFTIDYRRQFGELPSETLKIV